MKLVFWFFLLALSIESANADDFFDCRALTNLRGEVAAKLYVSSDRKVSFVYMAGEKFSSNYMLDGVDRRWDFGPTGNEYRMAIVLFPSGSANFYDFNDLDVGQKTKPRMIMSCERSANQK